MIQLFDEEIQWLVEIGSQVVYCFEFNFKLVSGFCLVQKLFDVGINVVLGIDGLVSNNDLDMIGEICIVVLFVKGVSLCVDVVLVVIVLCMVIFNGVRVLGLESCMGLLEIGKQVDMIVVDLGVLEI